MKCDVFYSTRIVIEHARGPRKRDDGYRSDRGYGYDRDRGRRDDYSHQRRKTSGVDKYVKYASNTGLAYFTGFSGFTR